jgi:S1-C subfamily serine protease
MALIPPSFIDCVVALGKAKPDGTVHWGASGFFYGKFFEESPEPDAGVYKVYLVTNKHVLEGHDQVSMRVNPQGAGRARDFTALLSDPSTKEKLWYGHDDDLVDVAVLPINFQLLLDEGMGVTMFTSDVTSLDVSAMKQSQVSEGDFVYALGFPLGLVGEERNTVIVRSGTIARVRETFDNPRYRFLVDAIIFPGNSGGPVVTKPELIAIKGTGAKTGARLIGIVSGYVPYQDMAISSQTNRVRVIFEENSGLTTVYSVDCVNEAIEALVKSVSGDSPPEAEPQPVDEGERGAQGVGMDEAN